MLGTKVNGIFTLFALAVAVLRLLWQLGKGNHVQTQSMQQ